MSEFPGDELRLLATYLDGIALWREAAHVTQAIKAYDELSLRCCEDNTKHSLTIAALRQRVSELETLKPLEP